MRIYQITQFLENSIHKWPERTAVKMGTESMTFSDLRAKALALAKMIARSLNNRPGQIVAVFMPKTIESVIADLAVLYSGNAYMNLDFKNPAARLESIEKRVRPSLYLCLPEQLPPVKNASEKILAFSSMELSPLPVQEQEEVLKICADRCDTDLMCLINTSGSTGEPKSVALCHRSFIDFTSAAHDAGLFGEGEIIGSLSPVIFDIFSFELCMVMAQGCTMILLPEQAAAFPARLLQILASENVSFIFWVPTIMVNIANMNLLASVPLPALRMVWFAGEVFPTAKFNYWQKMLPATTFANLYGPIEITLDCLYYVIDKALADNEPIPLGKPFKNTRILLLNEDGSEADKEGEICVSGSSLALGYYNNPEKTAAAFKLNPLNNAYPEIIYHTGDIAAYNDKHELIFLGRKDTLVKHKGYRIELGEIEHLAIASGMIENCCALYDTVEKKIVLVYQGNASPSALRKTLAENLPRYALPARYEKTGDMPRNANGKIDRYLLFQKYVKDGR